MTKSSKLKSCVFILALIFTRACKPSDAGPKFLSILTLPAQTGSGTSSSSTSTQSSTIGQFIVTPNSGLSVNENGSISTFTITLNQQPSSNVLLNSISINLTTEASLSQGNVVLNSSNWNTGATVTVTGLADNIIDGNQNWTISLGKATSSDTNFNGIDAGTVTGTTIDNDAFGMTVSPTTGLTTSNLGGSTTFTVVLNKAASGSFNVSIPITLSDTTLATVSPSTLYFNDMTWSTPQTVTVTGITTSLTPGNQAYTITVGQTSSTNNSLNGFSSVVSLVNIDANSNKFDITPTSGIVTSKAGASGTINFRLTSAPTSNVQITVSSSDTTQATVSPSLIVFTTSNWNTYKTITVTGVNNNLTQGTKNYSVVFGAASGGGSVFNGITPPSVSCSNTDTNSAGFQLSSTTISRNEGAVAGTVTVRLNTIPSANVVLNLSSSDTTNGGTVSPSTLTFTAGNWNTPQNISITPVAQDFTQLANDNYTIDITATSSDTNYNGLSVGPINATTVNIDTRGYTISQTSNFYVTGSGSVTTFTVKLKTIPVGGNVIIPISNFNAAKANVTPASLTFTNANWNVNQTITITGLDDSTSGNSTFQIQLGGGSSPFYPSAGSDDYSGNNISIGDYNGGNSGNFDVQYTGISGTKVIAVIPAGTALQANEGGASFIYYLNLSQAPTANVSIPVTSSNTARATITGSPFTLTSGNYNTFAAATKVTVPAVNDFLISGSTTVTIQHGTLTSTDGFFSGYNASGQNFTITVTDNDSFGFNRNQTAGSTNLITEYSGTYNTATYQIRLSARPNAGQTCSFNISSSDTTAATVSPSSMTFDNTTWNTWQNFTVTGVAGPVLNYNRNFNINFSNTTSGQSQFNNQAISSLTLSVVSNDIIVGSPSPDNQTSVTGTTRTFTVVLNSRPTGNVTIPISSSNTNAGTVSPSSLTFTNTNWNTAQTVTITGVNPSPIQNGPVSYQINLGPSTSGDAKYNGLTPSAVSMSNLDY